MLFRSAAGGIIIRVERGERPIWWSTARNNPLSMDKLFPDVHASEWAWIACGEDHVVSNDGTIPEFLMKINQIVIDHKDKINYNSSIDKPEGVL